MRFLPEFGGIDIRGNHKNGAFGMRTWQCIIRMKGIAPYVILNVLSRSCVCHAMVNCKYSPSFLLAHRASWRRSYFGLVFEHHMVPIIRLIRLEKPDSSRNEKARIFGDRTLYQRPLYHRTLYHGHFITDTLPRGHFMCVGLNSQILW